MRMTCAKAPMETEKRLQEAMERIMQAYKDGDLDVNEYAEMLLAIGMIKSSIQE